MNQAASLVPSEPLSVRATGAFLSFLAPGLGQIYQGALRLNTSRLIKGLFFLVTLLGMFFYGMWLGNWENVYVPHVHEQQKADGKAATVLGFEVNPLIGNLYTRLHYVGQFWVGAAAWPALWNYYVPEKGIFQRAFHSPGSVPGGNEWDRAEDLRRSQEEKNNTLNRLGKIADIAWVYTVIAGVLNILVIYDAWAGPMKKLEAPEAKGVAP